MEKTPPVEVIAIGPGRGESIVIRAAGYGWIVVDSCLHPTRVPQALHYLEMRGVAPDEVVLVVCTHWHDDHMKGMGALVHAYPSARFACTAAIHGKEFLELVAGTEMGIHQSSQPGLKEFARVLRELSARGAQYALAKENTDLLRVGEGLVVRALAPCDAQVVKGYAAIADLLPTKSNRNPIPCPVENPSSVVLWISCDGVDILLGGDLPTATDANEGWIAILDSPAKWARSASLFKVPHHGSPESDDNRIWSELLDKAVVALVTPYTPQRPLETDCLRLIESADRASISSSPHSRKQPKRHRIVKDQLASTTKWIQPQESEISYVHCIRETPGDSWVIDHYGSATPLDEIDWPSK